MQQQFPLTRRVVVHHVGLRVLADVDVNQPNLTVLNAAIGLVDRHIAGANAFHFATAQFDTALKLFQNLVLPLCLAVRADSGRVWILLVGLLFLVLLLSHVSILPSFVTQRIIAPKSFGLQPSSFYVRCSAIVEPSPFGKMCDCGFGSL